MPVARFGDGTERWVSFLGFQAAVVPIGIRAYGATSGPGGDTAAPGVALVFLLAILAIAVVGAVVAGYRGAGIAICILLPTCVAVRVNIAHWTAVDTLQWTLWRWSGPPLGLLLGFPVGVVGYLLGRAIRSARSHVPVALTESELLVEVGDDVVARREPDPVIRLVAFQVHFERLSAARALLDPGPKVYQCWWTDFCPGGVLTVADRGLNDILFPLGEIAEDDQIERVLLGTREGDSFDPQTGPEISGFPRAIVGSASEGQTGL